MRGVNVIVLALTVVANAIKTPLIQTAISVLIFFIMGTFIMAVRNSRLI